ncbi:MAG: carboxypeptidase-like regulatory domain-containing protein [Thermodesulfobacteriota bacterium]
MTSSQVFAYPDYQSLVNKEDYVKSSPGEKEGQYKLELPPGNYYLTATGELAGQRLFSYHGINPITIGEDYRWLPFFLSAEQGPLCTKGEGQGLSGLVSYQGVPLDHGVISVYNSQDGKFRGMGLFTNTIGADGLFRFNLEPGSYVVVARQKKAESGIGPVMQGDLFCYPATNPVIIAEEQLCELAIECYPRDNLEAYLAENAVNPQGRRHESRRQASLWNIQPETAQTAILSRPTTISGLATNLNGQPVADLIVTAYPALGIDLFQMHILRLITENRARTDHQGQYQIQLPGGGLYYLQARQKIGEAPNRLEYYGLYEGNQNHAIRINPGEARSNVNIPVSRIMPFSNLKERLRN